jgi:hypothetical protein
MPTKPFVETSKHVVEHIDPSKPVFVYRNLHKGCLSVQQDGIVRCHVLNIVLEDVEFRVSKAGQKRVRDEKKKNVHAKVKGMVVNKPSEILELGWHRGYYNPYQTTGKYLKSAKFCDIDADAGILTWGGEFFR